MPLKIFKYFDAFICRVLRERQSFLGFNRGRNSACLFDFQSELDIMFHKANKSKNNNYKILAQQLGLNSFTSPDN